MTIIVVIGRGAIFVVLSVGVTIVVVLSGGAVLLF